MTNEKLFNLTANLTIASSVDYVWKALACTIPKENLDDCKEAYYAALLAAYRDGFRSGKFKILDDMLQQKPREAGGSLSIFASHTDEEVINND